MKNVKLILSIKIILLSLILSFGFYNLYIQSNYIIFTTSFLVSLIFFKSIFNQIDLTNKNLTRFLQSIKFSDLSLSFTTEKMGKSYDELNSAFNEVLNEFKKTRGEREEKNRYLQTVLRHVGIGLIAFDTGGKIEFINRAARKLLGVQRITHLNISDQLNEKLSRELLQLKSGERSTIKLVDENDIVQLVVYATEFKMRNALYKLVSIQNIQSELEEKELEAWQKLIRVLTHEIMNSVTPISSLSATVNDILSNAREESPDEEQIDDIKNAVNAIHRRSEGLINFVENYRSLTKIPKPNFEIFPVRMLFDRVKNLLENDLGKFAIELSCEVNPETLELTADQSMIEQVLINLIINATHALSEIEGKKIRLSAALNEKGRVVIKVSDNGPGIPEDIQEKIFIPFFSTKSSGSGIGLSLAKQIIRSHRGNIRVTSKPFEETSLILTF